MHGMENWLDRPVIALAAMAMTLCVLAAFVIWYRVLVVRPAFWRKSTAAPTTGAMTGREVKGVVVSAGVAFVALGLLFGMLTAGKLRWYRWSTFEADLTFLSIFAAVIGAALFAVRSATHANCGNHGVYIFGGVSAAAGVAAFIMGV